MILKIRLPNQRMSGYNLRGSAIVRYMKGSVKKLNGIWAVNLCGNIIGLTFGVCCRPTLLRLELRSRASEDKQYFVGPIDVDLTAMCPENILGLQNLSAKNQIQWLVPLPPVSSQYFQDNY